MGLDCKAISGEQAVVVLTPRSMADAPGQRLIDLICGGMAAIAGQINRIAEEIFLFTPAGANVSLDEINNSHTI
jgi:FtsZ-interacting cell division protein YlmF